MPGRQIVALLALTWLLYGCRGGSSGPPAPSGLSYASTQHIAVGASVNLAPHGDRPGIVLLHFTLATKWTVAEFDDGRDQRNAYRDIGEHELHGNRILFKR